MVSNPHVQWRRNKNCNKEERAAFSESLHAGEGKDRHIWRAVLVPFLYLLTYTGWFLDEAFMYNNPEGSNLTFIWKLLAGFTTEVATDLI